MKKIILLIMVSVSLYGMDTDDTPNQSLTLPVFEIAEIYKTISREADVLWNDEDILCYAYQKQESRGANFKHGDWQGYKACCKVFSDKTQKKPYFKVRVFYKTCTRAKAFIEDMNALLDSKNIPQELRSCQAKEALSQNPYKDIPEEHPILVYKNLFETN